MNFDPDHPKWSYCCCHIRNGLMILAGSEIGLSLLISLCTITYIATADSEKYNNIPWPVIIMIPVFIIYGISSACLFFGLYKYKKRFMYPTVIARVLLAIVAHVTSGSIIVRSAGGTNDIGPHLTELVLLLIIFLFLLLLFVFDTVRSILLCIRYTKAYKRLRRKRSMNMPLKKRSNKAKTCAVQSPITNQADQRSNDDCNLRELSHGPDCKL
ncbi:hypothetical protein X798_05497 [Onchocerca flexuosa]|uniref:DUF7027 domain-containing protein n=1 Tax=Onchocerca flexuosa TaxID=387005 RepID=A0A238BQD5_9BILA|nr:hypothetical protein X798_05497 [Onchocerca flexuosa]